MPAKEIRVFWSTVTSTASTDQFIYFAVC